MKNEEWELPFLALVKSEECRHCVRRVTGGDVNHAEMTIAITTITT